MIFASNPLTPGPLPSGFSSTIVLLIVAALGSGGLTAFFKTRPEKSRILVDAAAGVVVVQTTVITDLREQLEEARERGDKQAELLEKAQTQINELRSHVAEMSMLRVENDTLKFRVSQQEAEIRRLRARVAELEQNRNTP